MLIACNRPLPARLIPSDAKTVLDACAAPGGKTMQLAAAGHEVLALDRSESRLARLADNLDRTVVHLNARDTNLVLISRGPYERLAAYRKRMGWTMEWVSSLGNSFNQDFAVSFAPDEIEQKRYNFGTLAPESEEMPGISVFARDGDAIFHTYSTYARGIDMLNGTYNLLDLVPKGRDEDALPFTMTWVRRRDEYGKA